MTALLQLDVAFEEVDQMDLANNAAVKGVLAEPQQPQLLAVHQMTSRAEQFIVLADASQVICALVVAQGFAVLVYLLPCIGQAGTSRECCPESELGV